MVKCSCMTANARAQSSGRGERESWARRKRVAKKTHLPAN